MSANVHAAPPIAMSAARRARICLPHVPVDSRDHRFGSSRMIASAPPSPPPPAPTPPRVWRPMPAPHSRSVRQNVPPAWVSTTPGRPILCGLDESQLSCATSVVLSAFPVLRRIQRQRQHSASTSRRTSVSATFFPIHFHRLRALSHRTLRDASSRKLAAALRDQKATRERSKPPPTVPWSTARLPGDSKATAKDQTTATKRRDPEAKQPHIPPQTPNQPHNSTPDTEPTTQLTPRRRTNHTTPPPRRRSNQT